MKCRLYNIHCIQPPFLLISVSLVLIITSHHLWTARIVDGRCETEDTVSPFITAVFYAVIPFLLLTIFNSLIIYTTMKVKTLDMVSYLLKSFQNRNWRCGSTIWKTTYWNNKNHSFQINETHKSQFWQAKKTQRGMTSNVTFHRVKRQRTENRRERSKTEDDVSVIEKGSVIEIKDEGQVGGKVVGLRRGV